MLVGSYFGIMLEEKKVNFKLNSKIWKRFVEGACALAVALLVKTLLKMPYKNLELSVGLLNVLDAIRYGITCFMAIGVVPLVYKVTGFNRGE